MFGNMPKEIREMGSLNLKVGDMVRMNPDAMLNGGGLALVVAKDKIEGLYQVYYLKNGYETTADDMLDILEVVNKN